MMNESPAIVPLRFFRSLQSKDYAQLWACLSLHSQEMIVQILAKSLGSTDAQVLKSSFEKGQGTASLYWDAFRTSVQLETWLAQSYKPLGLSGNEVIVKASPSGANLMVLLEGTAWKFGYIETFLES